MSKLFPHNIYGPEILKQPEIEYRTAKYPQRMRMEYKIAETGEIIERIFTHCPVCFWQYGCWDSLIDRSTKFCSRCGQKIKWEEDEKK